MTRSLNITFEETFKISTKSLRFNRSHPNIVRDRLWKFQFFVVCFISFSVLLLLIYSVGFHNIKNGEFAAASKNCTMIIVSATITIKYLSLLIFQDSVKDMIKFLENDYNGAENDYSEEDIETVLEYANKGVNVCKFWLVAGFGTCAIFPLCAFTAMAYNYWKGEFQFVPMFELVYPEPVESHKNNPVIFCFCFLLALSFDIYASSMYVGFDPIVPIFLLHVCGQLVILSRRLSKVFDSVEDPREIEIQLKRIVNKLQDLYGFVDTIKTNYSLLYEYNLKTTTFLLPLTAFQVLEDVRNHWINPEFVSFLLACTLHFFIPSYYSDLLMEMSEYFRHSIYSSGWEKCPDKRVRQIILFMITRARIPMGIRTVFVAINLDTFAEMCRQSYAILNLMNAAWS